MKNNPLSYTDPSGFFLKKLFKKLKKFIKKALGTIVQIVFTAIGMPYVGAFLGSAINAAFSKGNFLKNFGMNLAVSLATMKIVGARAPPNSAGGGLGGITFPGTDVPILNIAPSSSAPTLAEVAGGFVKEAAHHYVNELVRREAARIAHKNGLSLLEANAALIGLSLFGDSIGRSRLRDDPASDSVQLRGILERKWYQLPFDGVDIVLAYQGLPTGAALKYLAKYRGAHIDSHSLASMDAANLIGLHLASSARLDAVPFGKIVPLRRNVDVRNSNWDFVSGFGLGRLLNPEAESVHGKPLGHSCGTYEMAWCRP